MLQYTAIGVITQSPQMALAERQGPPPTCFRAGLDKDISLLGCLPSRSPPGIRIFRARSLISVRSEHLSGARRRESISNVELVSHKNRWKIAIGGLSCPFVALLKYRSFYRAWLDLFDRSRGAPMGCAGHHRNVFTGCRTLKKKSAACLKTSYR